MPEYTLASEVNPDNLVYFRHREMGFMEELDPEVHKAYLLKENTDRLRASWIGGFVVEQGYTSDTHIFAQMLRRMLETFGKGKADPKLLDSFPEFQLAISTAFGYWYGNDGPLAGILTGWRWSEEVFVQRIHCFMKLWENPNAEPESYPVQQVIRYHYYRQGVRWWYRMQHKARLPIALDEGWTLVKEIRWPSNKDPLYWVKKELGESK